jgi:cytoskeletal protein RodZ
MHHIKLIVFAIVLAVVIIFGFIFWDDLKFNQQEIANTPLPPSPLVDDNSSRPQGNAQQQSESDQQPALSEDDGYDDLEKDLNQTELEIDSDSAELESEMSGL